MLNDTQLLLYLFVVWPLVGIISFVSAYIIGKAQDKSLMKTMESSSYVLRCKRKYAHQILAAAIVCFSFVVPVFFLPPEDEYNLLSEVLLITIPVLLGIIFTIIYIYSIKWKVVVDGGTMTVTRPFFKPATFNLTQIVKVKEAAKHIYDAITNYHVDGYVVHVKEPANDVKRVLKINEEFTLGFDVFKAHMLAIDAPIEKQGLFKSPSRKNRFIRRMCFYALIMIPIIVCGYFAITSLLDGDIFYFVVFSSGSMFFAILFYSSENRMTAKVEICDKGVTVRCFLFGKKIFMPWSECAHIVVNKGFSFGGVYCNIHISKAPVTEEQMKDMKNYNDQLHFGGEKDLLENMLKYVDRSRIKNLHILEEALENQEK